MNAESNIANRTNTSGHAGTDAAAHLAHDFIDAAAKHLKQPEEKLRETARNAEQTLKSSLSAARTRGKSAGYRTRSIVQQHPLAAVGLALGLGVIIALLAGRRESIEKPEPPASE